MRNRIRPIPEPIDEVVSSDASPVSPWRTFKQSGQYDLSDPDEKLMFDTHNLYAMLETLTDAKREGHTQVCVRQQGGFQQWIPLTQAIEIVEANLESIKATYFN